MALLLVSSRHLESLRLADTGEINLGISALPYYVARSVVRMFIAFALSVLFSLVYGYVAAHSRIAEAIMVPVLDILQSVPVLGFLSVAIASLASVLPTATAYELASIFAIFTSQAWNMTFAFYQSLLAIPNDLREAARVYRLSRWQTFKFLEIPSSMISLVWNGMMSFGGGWFFLAASEAITVLGKDVRLPGIGSYMATAIERSDSRAMAASLVSMAAIIVILDQFIWRPVVAWSRKFKVEMTVGNEESDSWLLNALQQSVLLRKLDDWTSPLGKFFTNLGTAISRTIKRVSAAVEPAVAVIWRYLSYGVLGVFGVGLIYYGGSVGVYLARNVSVEAVASVFKLGFLTLLRVLASVVLGLLWTVPVGVRVGMNPRVRKIAQPFVQIAASFPANMLFPFVTMFYVRHHVNFEYGAVPLMMLGTQWYLLFNVIGGAMSVPNDLLEAAEIFRLRGLSRWRHLLLPCLMPSIVTGGITAAGGAWNASIVAEVTSWGSTTLQAQGLGSFITEATAKGDWPAIILGIFTMSLIVVLFNRFVWRRLYQWSESLKSSYQ